MTETSLPLGEGGHSACLRGKLFYKISPASTLHTKSLLQQKNLSDLVFAVLGRSRDLLFAQFSLCSVPADATNRCQMVRVIFKVRCPWTVQSKGGIGGSSLRV